MGGEDIGQQVPIVDAAFVDDECLMLTASSPAALDRAIDVLLAIVTRVFDLLRLEINWKPGKTECFLRYRGRQAAAKLQARRTGPDSSLVVAVPGTPHVITVVGKYKHLGGVTCADQSITADAQCKRRAAAAAYGPLAVKIFASTKVEEELKLQLMWSLVMSRLLYNVHVIVPTRAYLRALNGVYMRGVRRIGDQCRFEQTSTDAEVRRAAGAPSIDCILCRTRLRYFASVLRSSPATLLALLSSRPRGRLLPWVALIVADMHKLRSLSSLCAPLPCPEEAPGAWVAFALESPHRWARAVACLFFVDSACDVRPAAADGMLHPFACAACDARFLNARALASHTRRKHGVRVAQREYAHGSAICQVCLSSFGTSLRLLRHLCD